MIILLILLVLTAVLPLAVKPIEKNIEIFLGMIGILAAAVSGTLTTKNISLIFHNRYLYMITGAVLTVSILFTLAGQRIRRLINKTLSAIPLRAAVFLLVVGLGLLSSVITAIIASLLLVEIASALPVDRDKRVKICIISCFSIGLGAVLTPLGEPLSTIVTSKIQGDFGSVFRLLGGAVIPGILVLGIIAAVYVGGSRQHDPGLTEDGLGAMMEKEDARAIFKRTAKVFLFMISLELLGFGFEPVIDGYIVHWGNTALYSANTISALLDNATLAAAEIGFGMTNMQMKYTLVSLTVSGGMMVTGNIPNIVTASKLKISMKEWFAFGIPLGAVLLTGYYLLLSHLPV
ncbi:MAG TPA: DUF1646 family protein [Clostridia bacterium]|nr:DUF1646 family protein [Clostridia bacterium]